MDDWMKEFRLKQQIEKQQIEKATKAILEAIKGLDTISCTPEIFANVFDQINKTDGLKNQTIEWANEIFVGRKMSKLTKKLEILYKYCKDKGYSEDNTWQWGSGDRTVCYVENDSKDILLFENQNIQFVVVFDGHKVHVREVYKSIYDAEYFYGHKGNYFNDVEGFKQGLKQDNGIEIAIANLTGQYSRYSNSVEGNEYPDRIDLNNMKKHNFDKDCNAFRYGDNRDPGYLVSAYKETFLSEKCEINDINKLDYVFNDMNHATQEIPKKYIKAIKRDNRLNELLK